MKKLSRKDIPDALIDEALIGWKNEPKRETFLGPLPRAFPDYVIELTGYPWKVVYAALDRAWENGIIGYGASVRFPAAGPNHSSNKKESAE
jgi:hypothetical protein